MGLQRRYWVTCMLLIGLSILSEARETVKEAALLARNMVDSKESSATLATTFPLDHPTLPGQPFALMEYYASCYANGSLSFIFMPISQNNRNILYSFGHAATFTVAHDPPKARTSRVALMGNVTVIYPDNAGYRDVDQAAIESIERCFLERHPDAKYWIPGRKPAHTAYWARFDPHTIYYVGGFGNEHYIGFIPLTMYQEAHLQWSSGGPVPNGGLEIQ